MASSRRTRTTNPPHDAWRKGVGQIQQRAKVEIVGENDLPMCLCPAHDCGIFGANVSDPAPMCRPVAGFGQKGHPDLGDVHVQQQIHDALSGMSCSSVRQLA
jgi:hypothetical protein